MQLQIISIHRDRISLLSLQSLYISLYRTVSFRSFNFFPLAFRPFFVSHPSILGLIKSIRNPGVGLFPIFPISKNLILHFFLITITLLSRYFLFFYFFFFTFHRAISSHVYIPKVSTESISITLYNRVLTMYQDPRWIRYNALTRVSKRRFVSNAFSDSRWNRYTRHCVPCNSSLPSP